MAGLIKKGKVEYHEKLWSDISPGALDLVQSMLNSNPDQRITASAILKHPWIIDHATYNKKSLESFVNISGQKWSCLDEQPSCTATTLNSPISVPCSPIHVPSNAIDIHQPTKILDVADTYASTSCDTSVLSVSSRTADLSRPGSALSCGS